MIGPVTAELSFDADALASPPRVVRRACALAQDPQADAAAMARLAVFDPALTARLLAQANDPRWGQSGLVDCVARAVAVLDLATLRRLMQGLPAPAATPEERCMLEAQWHLDVHAAVAARAVALQGGRGRPHVVFTAGLLLGTGERVLRLRALAGRAAPRGPFDPARAGGALLAAWRLPDCLCACVACHREPLKARSFRAEVAIAHIARALADLAVQGSEDFRSAPAVESEAWLRAGLTPAEGLALLAAVREQAAAAHRLFGDSSGR